jgi:AcrR family transcriptional regulator
MQKTQLRASYHHGDLPAALIDACFELIEQNGVHGFSLAEAARRTGVSISAPYRHFADREELLVACAVVACEELKGRFDPALAEKETPAEKLAAASATYVRFAAERRPMFEVLYGAGLDKAKHPRLAEAASGLYLPVTEIALQLTPDGNEEAAGILVQAITGLAQGYATMLVESGLSDSADMVAITCERAEAATAALLHGRSLLLAAPNAST